MIIEVRDYHGICTCQFAIHDLKVKVKLFDGVRTIMDVASWTLRSTLYAQGGNFLIPLGYSQRARKEERRLFPLNIFQSSIYLHGLNGGKCS